MKKWLKIDRECGFVSALAEKKTKVRAGALRSGKTQSCGCKTSKGNLQIKKNIT